MTVQTKSVKGRRTVSYQSYDDLLADAEEMAHGVVQTLGNWSLGQIFKHLASSFEGSIDGLPFRAPLHFRLLAPLLKRRLLSQPLPSGFQIAKTARSTLEPDATASTAEALDALRYAVSRCESESNRAPHPVLGKLSKSEWDQFNLRHAEMHMSFVVPADE